MIIMTSIVIMINSGDNDNNDDNVRTVVIVKVTISMIKAL